jgi:hypothetical protein
LPHDILYTVLEYRCQTKMRVSSINSGQTDCNCRPQAADPPDQVGRVNERFAYHETRSQRHSLSPHVNSWHANTKFNDFSPSAPAPPLPHRRHRAVAAGASATLAQSCAASATPLALAASLPLRVARQHAGESRRGSIHPRRPLHSCQGLAGPIEPPHGFAAHKPRQSTHAGSGCTVHALGAECTLWLHSPRSGCAVQLCWHARDGLWGAGASWASWASSPAFPLLRHRGELGRVGRVGRVRQLSPGRKAEASQAASPPLKAQTSWRPAGRPQSPTPRW